MTTPTLIHAMVATDAHDGELEITAVVAAVARRQRLDALPRWPRRSLLRGVQLLTDVAPAMAPYLADTELVAAAVSRVVGRGNTDHLRFAGTPLDGAGEGSAWTWAEYRPPPPGTPVLAVAELGLARVPGRLVGELHRSWLELRELLAGRGSPLVVLTPFPRDRWPDELAARVDLVHWDRSCTVSSVRRSRRQSPAPDGVAP